ncbi:MAG: hypothetical protein HY858_14290 [Candidatus Solibacter usitatus]|nr:hypothetical protein [Candidatus Solibacter usitatus]
MIVSGGDGTLFHLLRRLRPPFPEIAIVPSGRGNALARDLRGCSASVAIDLMEVTVFPADGEPWTCWCASSVGFGYPAEVTRTALRFRRLRRFSYAAATAVSAPRRGQYTITVGGQAEARRLTGVLVNNTRHVGGFVAFPRASLSDGLVECMEFDACYLSQMAHNATAMAGTELWMPARLCQAVEVRIRPDRPRELMLDGELVAEIAEVLVNVAPGALRCMVLNPARP